VVPPKHGFGVCPSVDCRNGITDANEEQAMATQVRRQEQSAPAVAPGAPEFGLALHRFLAQPTEATHRDLWRHCAFDLDGLRQRMGERWQPFETYNLDRARAPSVQTAVATLMKHFGMPAIPRADLAWIAAPTTLVWGRHDRATPLSAAAEASARYGWPLHVIENCNDDPPVEQPEALLRTLCEALGGR
jgi:pimeloyl-ACP methyl ester carboxylesterase